MRTSMLLLSVALAALAQSPSGPVAGYIPDSTQEKLLPVLGIPGAALLGDPIALGAGRSILALSPSQDYVLAARRTDGAPLVVAIGGRAGERAIEGGLSNTDRAVTSPNGSAAVLTAGRQLQIVTGLPDAPRAASVVDLTALGALGAVAVSDDGSQVLVRSGVGSAATLYSVNAGGTLRLMAPLAEDVLLSFAHQSHAAAIGGLATHQVWTLDDASGDYAPRRLAGPENGIGGLAGIGFSTDNLRVFAAHSAGASVMDRNASTVALVSCSCTPTGLAPLRGNSLFRLTDPSGEPMWLLDGSGATAQVWFVPPIQTTAASKGGIRR